MFRIITLFAILLTCFHVEASEVHFTILHTTDLHSKFLPGTDYDGEKDSGGVTKCATMIQKIRAEEKNVLLVDAGDLIQGSPIGYLTKGSIMVKAINSLNYDAWTIGNHEFDWGIETLADRINECKIPVLSANLHVIDKSGTADKAVEAFNSVKPFIIKEVEGVKIGIVGLTTPAIESWSRPRLIHGLEVEHSVEALKRVMPQMKAAGCQVFILVTHQGYREGGDDHANEIEAITRSFPELNIIIGGHSHRLFESRFIHRILYAQAAYWGTYLGRIDVSFDTDKNKVSKLQSTAIKMDASVEADKNLINEFKDDLKRTDEVLDTTIGKATATIDALTGPKRETSMFNLICSGIAAKLSSLGDPVDAVIHGILSRHARIMPGVITMRDMFEIVPYENTIGAATLTGTQLRSILEENAGMYQSDRFRGMWGLTSRIKPSAPAGKKVVLLGDQHSRPLDEAKTYRVAFNSYDLASGGERWKLLSEIVNKPEAKLKEYDFQTRDVVAEYIKSHSPIKPELNGWWQIERAKSSAKP